MIKNTELSTLLTAMSNLFTDICDDSAESQQFSEKKVAPIFYSKKPPKISIKDYLIRLIRYCKFSNSTLVLSLIYIDKLCNETSIKLSYFNIHKIILGAVILSIKYNEDEYYDFSFYAKVGGVTKAELVKIEAEFIVKCNFNLFTDAALFEKYYNYLITTGENLNSNAIEDEKLMVMEFPA